ncbi:MAG: hypothetical protein LW817_01620, partial [Candidatus Caenarcaniphilales bacterium]|nr:hypothetical protein [Candidatus Caenarcaniphilales bacterium]
LIDDISQATKFNGISLLYQNTAATADVLLQTGADAGQTTTVTLRSEQAANTGVEIDITEVVGSSDDEGHLIEGASANFALDRLQIAGASVNSLNYGTHSTNFAASVGDIDVLIENISRMRSYLGATQNALESKIEYMDIAMENASGSRSRIQDVDVAYESSILVKNQILQQTASAMLSQANSQPQIALRLLQQ